MTADLITSLNAAAAVWWTWFAAVTWQASLFIAVVAISDRLFGRHIWPQVRYAVWLLAFVKLVLPPTLGSQWSVVGRLADSHSIYVPTSTGVAEWSAPVTDAVTASSDVIATGYVEPVLPGLDWQVVMLLVWLVGILAFGALIGVKIYRIKATIRNADDPTPLMLEQLERAAQAIGLRRTPCLRVTDAIPSAAVFGLFHPTLFVSPSDDTGEASRPEAMYHVYLHEIAHIKRGDLVVQAVSVLLLTIFWPNPLVWYATKRAGQVREICTDATVSTVLQDETSAYRRTLLSAAQKYLDLPTPALSSLGLLGLVEGPTMMMERLRSLSDTTWKHTNLKRAIALGAAVALALTVLPMCESKSGEPTDSEGVVGNLTMRGSIIVPTENGLDTLSHDFAPVLPKRPQGSPEMWSDLTRANYVQSYREAVHAADDAAVAHLRQAIADGRITTDNGLPEYPDFEEYDDDLSRFRAINDITRPIAAQIMTGSDIDGNLVAGLYAWMRIQKANNIWGFPVYRQNASQSSIVAGIDEPAVLIIPAETVYIDSDVGIGTMRVRVVVGTDGMVELTQGDLKPDEKEILEVQRVEQVQGDRKLDEKVILEVQRSAAETTWEPAMHRGNPVPVAMWIQVQVAKKRFWN
jgi:beta-lactamase regulating signal transducer with metallopeptidase domain